MRRIVGGLLAFIVITGTLLVLPVYAAPLPEAEPVAPSIDAVQLGSVDQPEREAVVTDGGAVVDAGPLAPVASPAPGSTVPTTSVSDDVATSGTEIPDVPALTVSRPDTAPFSLVGVTWAQDAGADGVTVQLRTRPAHGSWTPWTEAEGDDMPAADVGSGSQQVRGGTEPIWTDDSRGVEVIVQAADGSIPRDVRLELVDPGTSPADAQPGAPEITDTAHAAMSIPSIYSRAQWGADESMMGWAPEYASTTKAATIHHTATSNDYSKDDVPRILRGMYAFHAKTRGWGDIGYNVLVDKYGRTWEGRTGGLASSVVGAHAGAMNAYNFGVSMIGDYNLVTPPDALVRAVAAVVAWKFSLYGVDPRGKATLTSGGGGTARFPAGAHVTLPTIRGHRDSNNTDCPGKHGYAALGQIRALVAQQMADPALQTAPSLPFAGLARSYLRHSNGTDDGYVTVPRGDRGDVPIACDWNGDGDDTMGVFRRGRFILFDSDLPSARPVADFWFGDAGDQPLCGDWDGDGKASIGVWRSGWFYLRNNNSAGSADGNFAYGNTDAQPVVGNWNGDPYDTVGVYQGNVFYWTNTNIRPAAAGRVTFGDAGDRIVAGDWTGRGHDGVGVFRAGSRSSFFLSNEVDRGVADSTVPFGQVGDRPTAADVNGNRTDTVGVSRDY